MIQSLSLSFDHTVIVRGIVSFDHTVIVRGIVSFDHTVIVRGIVRNFHIRMILQNSYKLQMHFFTPSPHCPNDANIQVWTSEFLPHIEVQIP
jgi:hypothetical protein